MRKILVTFVLVMAVLALDPPTYNYAFKINFDETFIINKAQYKVNGQFIYDPVNNRERVDRTNGRYDIVCGTVLPNTTTPCQQITVNNTRWIVFPQKTSCCACCDAAHGCGILRPDWLKGATYIGKEVLIDTAYEKWSKQGKIENMQVISVTTTSGPQLTKTDYLADLIKTVSITLILTPIHSTTRLSHSQREPLLCQHTAIKAACAQVISVLHSEAKRNFLDRNDSSSTLLQND